MENNKELLQTKTQLILKEAETLGASQAQATITLTSRALTRLANSIIDQNVADKHAKVKIAVYFGQKNGSVEFEVIEDDEIKQAVEQAVAFARISPENKDFKSLPSPKPYASDFDVISQVCETTHNATPEKRAELAKLAIDTAHDVDSRVFAVAGFVQNITVEKRLLTQGEM
jgi:predicted Zn-dependent protease